MPSNYAFDTASDETPIIPNSPSEARLRLPLEIDLTQSHDLSPSLTLRSVTEAPIQLQPSEMEMDDLEKNLPAATDLLPEPHDSRAAQADKPTKDPNLITFDDLDSSINPMNWSKGYKWLVTVTMALLTLAVTFASSMFSTAAMTTAMIYKVSTEVTVLGTSLYVLGFAFGPIVWGPMSELYGRRLPLLLGVLGCCLFQVGVAVAQNIYTIFLCRFFAGLWGSSPLAVVAGAFADFWDPVERGAALGLFSIMTFAGPVLAPVIGGFVDESYLGWRWTEWLTVFFGFFALALGALIIPETYHPMILSREAKQLRHKTQNWAIHAKSDENEINAKVLLYTYLLRPFKMFWMEPILLLITLYMSLVYGILYLFFIAYPISFSEERHWSLGVGALPFLSLFVGVFFGGAYIGIWSKKNYLPQYHATGGKVPPEERLPPMVTGGVVITVGLFWWAWSSFTDVKALWVSQTLAGIPVGAGILIVFVQGLSYLVDCYKWIANSAIAASTFFRSMAGAGFPLFATAMYHTLGVQWATSLLGFLCLALIPVPLLFYKFGKRIRAKSKFVPHAGF